MAFPKFKTAAEVPEAFRAAYHEVAGEWIALEDDGLGAKGKAALERERENAEKAERRAKAAEDKARAAEETAAALKAGLTDEDAKRFREDTTKAIRAEFQAQLDTLSSENLSMKLDHKVKAMALKAGVLPERLDDFWALNGAAFQLDSKGEPEVRDGKGKAVPEYITGDLKKARPYLYGGTKADGGGAGGVQTTTTPGTAGLTMDQLLKNPSLGLGAQEKLSA